MYRRTKPSLFILIVLVTVSCVPATDASFRITPTPILVTATQIPTSFSTTEPTSTPSIVPMPPVLEKCVDTSTNQSQLSLKGVLVLEETRLTGFIEGGTFPVYTKFGYFYDAETASFNVLNAPGMLLRLIGVSPDRTKLLYTYLRDNEENAIEYLVIADSNGRPMMDFTARTEEYWWDYYSWLNNDVLRTADIEYKDDKLLLGVFNLRTNEYTLLKTDWDNYYNGKIVDWIIDKEAVDTMVYNGTNIIYDPTLTRVLYPQNHGQIALADVETGNILDAFQTPQMDQPTPLWGRMPRWSDDGENLAIVISQNPARFQGSDELYLVSRDGYFQRLTQLTNEFDTVHISEYAWSPDGKRIAFWLNTEAGNPTVEGTQSNLAILNIETRQITNLCIQGISALTHMKDDLLLRYIQPVWSPDGKQIMFAQLDPNEAESFNVIIVDLEINIAWIVDSNKQPVGWMVKP